MKKNKLYLTILISLFFIQISYSQSNISAGFILGSPSGLTAKYKIDDISSVNFAVGWAAFHNSEVGFNVDYLFNSYDVEIKGITEKFKFTYGVGLRMGFATYDKNNIGGRGVAVLSWYNQQRNIELFTELAPAFIFIPRTIFRLDAAIGVRFLIN